MIFAPLPPILAGAILVDPPWRWRAWSRKGEGRSAVNHYDVLDVEALKTLPVESIAAKDCALFLWAINSMLPEAFELIDAWGFVFKTMGFTWVKTTLAGDRFPFGCGYWTRANPEPCLFATRGKPQRRARDVPQLIVAPRGREHSPRSFREGVEGRAIRSAATPKIEWLRMTSDWHARAGAPPHRRYNEALTMKDHHRGL